MTLRPEDLHVESFATAQLARPSEPGTSGDDPNCIVYISDCVSCPPDDGLVND